MLLTIAMVIFALASFGGGVHIVIDHYRRKSRNRSHICTSCEPRVMMNRLIPCFCCRRNSTQYIQLERLVNLDEPIATAEEQHPSELILDEMLSMFKPRGGTRELSCDERLSKDENFDFSNNDDCDKNVLAESFSVSNDQTARDAFSYPPPILTSTNDTSTTTNDISTSTNEYNADDVKLVKTKATKQNWPVSWNTL
mmetsp:Transcript_16027/g.31314  ORF Transcript_16027/g.31314 Transcript_16027/m.31314 type:complete len:197 (-) Transcript_16027:76-666(-)